jgi:hypothetical protein
LFTKRKRYTIIVTQVNGLIFIKGRSAAATPGLIANIIEKDNYGIIYKRRKPKVTVYKK